MSSARVRVCDLLGEDPWHALAPARPTVAEALRDCPPGGVRQARYRGREVAVYRLHDGRAFQVPDVCPHDGRSLSDGYVEGELLVCARHQWEFDCQGRCVGRPEVTLPVRQLRPRR